LIVFSESLSYVFAVLFFGCGAFSAARQTESKPDFFHGCPWLDLLT